MRGSATACANLPTHDLDVKRDAVAAVLVEHLALLKVSVGEPAAEEWAERPAWHERHAAADDSILEDEVFGRFLRERFERADDVGILARTTGLLLVLVGYAPFQQGQRQLL